MIGAPKVATFTIADGQSLSNARFIGGQCLYLIIPGAITSAAITFQVSADGTNFFNLYGDDASGTEVSLAASTGQRAYRLSGDYWKAVQWIKVRSGTSGVPVNQAGGDDIQIVNVS